MTYLDLMFHQYSPVLLELCRSHQLNPLHELPTDIATIQSERIEIDYVATKNPHCHNDTYCVSAPFFSEIQNVVWVIQYLCHLIRLSIEKAVKCR